MYEFYVAHVYIIMWYLFKYQTKYYGLINNKAKILLVNFWEVSFLN